ncbi:hypothetical protein [Luteococcus peritonei]|uniref:Lipoprotein n=1 Tax=Luteococcus peritonei TaxID=88874 RepID=A0ABW4RUB7_9ACTN
MRRGAAALAVLVIVLLSGCSDEPEQTEPTPSGPGQVELGYTVPAGMKEVTVPASSPSGGMRYDIKLFTGSDGCELRAVRLLLPKGDGTQDTDATYNMLGAVMEASGVTQFKTEGLAVAGRPGPVPALAMEGSSSALDLRAAGRMSNDSLQGFQLVYGCPRGKLQEETWHNLLTTMTVDGFTGSIKQD